LEKNLIAININRITARVVPGKLFVPAAMTKGAPIVDNPTGGTTIGVPFVINSTETMTNGRQFVIDG